MKKVLMIAQYFPPVGGVGTFRVTKFAKYLREYGWEPVVLTVREDCYPNTAWLDRGLDRDIPQSVHVYRTRIWQSWIINDQGIRWLPFLLLALVKAIREECPDIVYLTGGPFFPLIAGPIIKLLFRLPYVIDLRDPWKLARQANPSRGFKARLGQLLTNVIEPIVLRHATAVVFATPSLRKEYQAVYCGQSRRFFSITNGYDPDDFRSIIPRQYEEFTIVYTGKFRRSEAFHNPSPIFQAMKALRQRGINVHFVHVGPREEEVVTLAEAIGVRDDVEFTGPKSHAEALSYAVGGSLLLVIGSNRKMGLPVKMFDYIGCQRPLLVVGFKGEEMLALAAEIPSATVIEEPDSQAIATAIEKVYFGRQKMEGAESIEGKYHRRNLTGILARIFDDVVTKENQG